MKSFDLHCNKVVLSKKLFYICKALVCHFCSEAAIKRELGVSPKQSRCCKFQKCCRHYFYATGGFLLGRRLQQKRVRRPAMQTIIIAFEEKALSLMSRTNRSSFHSSNLIQRK